MVGESKLSIKPPDRLSYKEQGTSCPLESDSLTHTLKNSNGNLVDEAERPIYFKNNRTQVFTESNIDEGVYILTYG